MIHKLGCLKPRTTRDLLNVAMNHASSEEAVKVVELALLGLLAHVKGHGDQSRVGRSAPILLVLFAPLCGGALVLVLTLGLALVPASAKNCSDRLLTGGMVRGDIE